jgi:hypothetical protein
MKRIILLTIALASFMMGAAQNVSIDPGVDFMSRYVWRGLKLGGSSPSIQPSIKFSAGNFTLGSWGAFAIDNSFTVQETDLFATYNFSDAFSLTVTDYFLPDESLANNHYFEMKEDSTGHVLEGAVSFNGTDKIPFTFMAAVNFWGADARTAGNKKQYSTYFELGYNRTVKETNIKVFIGGTATNPDTEAGETGYYGDSAGITNIGISAVKKIALTDKFSLPVSTSFIVNPQAENVFLVLGISL